MLHLPITSPTLIFFVVLLIILLSPIIMGRLRIPHIIGLVLFGVLVGPSGLGIIERDDSFELFGKVGLYYIMFLAALEMDLDGLRANLKRMLLSGLLTFVIPFALTLYMGQNLLHYSIVATLLLCCIMASNTLIAYPIVTRLGLQKKASVALSVGASMISLLLALITMAAVVGAHTGTSDVVFWLWFVGKIVALSALLIFIVPYITRWFLRNYSDSIMQFIFMLAIMFLAASIAEIIGLEGIIGAFLSGLVLNHYIPRVSPLMNRLEFTGNALFIPYFLIGVGMLINIHVLTLGGNIIYVILLIVLFGTIGKAIAAYLTMFLCRMNITEGHMIFGLTSAHAAGAIAIITVGMRLVDDSGLPIVSDEMINGVVIMILVTCIISTLITQGAAERMLVEDKEIPSATIPGDENEKILVAVKYPEYASRLISLAIMMKKESQSSIFGLNLVYDDIHVNQNYDRGVRLLDRLSRFAAAADVTLETQVRVAENIANGIKHAFVETTATEIIIGMHMHKERSASFWGDFHQSLFNGLNRQITMASLVQPLNTLTKITVAVPSKAQFEPGFYRWIDRLCRLCENMDSRLEFHAREDTAALIGQFVNAQHASVKASFVDMEHWNMFPNLAASIKKTHLFVIIAARQGTISYKNAQDKMPEEFTKNFSGSNFLIIFPDQHGDLMNEMTFSQSQHIEGKSAYESLRNFILKRILHKK